MYKCFIIQIASAFIVSTLLAWSCSSNAVVILQYHHISEKTPASTSLSPKLFSQHMEHLKNEGYQILSLPTVLEELKKGRELPDKSVVITFDDSYDSVYYAAFPILKKNKWPFTVFITTAALQKNLAGFTSWEQLREMGNHGATLANHSHSHTHFLRKEKHESQRQWRLRIIEEITEAEKLIKEKTGQSHRLIAYPYGEFDAEVLAIVEELEFVGFGQQSGPVAPKLMDKQQLLALPRFPFGGVYGSIDDFKTKAATKAMPITNIRVEDSSGERLSDPLLPKGVDIPRLSFELPKDFNAPIQCFASGQGAIKVTINGSRVETRAYKGLPVGRSRYNCTASTTEPGRFYWYSQFFIRKKDNGEWYPEP